MGGRGKNFAVCPDGTHGKVFDLLSVQMGVDKRQINCLPSVKNKHTANQFLPSVFFLPCFFLLHSVNQLFAECSR